MADEKEAKPAKEKGTKKRQKAGMVRPSAVRNLLREAGLNAGRGAKVLATYLEEKAKKFIKEEAIPLAQKYKKKTLTEDLANFLAGKKGKTKFFEYLELRKKRAEEREKRKQEREEEKSKRLQERAEKAQQKALEQAAKLKARAEEVERKVKKEQSKVEKGKA